MLDFNSNNSGNNKFKPPALSVFDINNLFSINENKDNKLNNISKPKKQFWPFGKDKDKDEEEKPNEQNNNVNDTNNPSNSEEPEPESKESKFDNTNAGTDDTKNEIPKREKPNISIPKDSRSYTFPMEIVKYKIEETDYRVKDRELNFKVACIVNNYEYVRPILLRSTVEIASVLPSFLAYLKDNQFPVIFYESDILERKLYNNLLKSPSLSFAALQMLVDLMVRTYLLTTSYYNVGIKNAFRTYESVRKSMVELYYQIYYWFMRKYLFIALSLDNERQLANVVIFYIAYCLLGITDEGGYNDFVSSLNLEIISFKKSETIRMFKDAKSIVMENKNRAIVHLINEFIDFEPKIAPSSFVQVFITRLTQKVAEVFIPNLADIFKDSDTTLSFTVSRWTDILFFGDERLSNAVIMMKRASGFSFKELSNSFADIVLRAHMDKC